MRLAGKTVGVLVGSSEDYELEGYLALEHLTGKVKVVSFPSETAAGAAALSGAVFAAYVQGVPAADLIQQKGYHQLVDAEQIAKLGVPGIGVIAVSTSVVNSDPTLVQDYVCAEVQATNDMTGPQADKYLTEAAGVQGVPANLVVTATKAYYPEIIPVDQQLFWLGSTLHDPTSRLVKAYQLTAKFLIGQGRLTTIPSAAQIASHVNISFLQKALAGGCPSPLRPTLPSSRFRAFAAITASSELVCTTDAPLTTTGASACASSRATCRICATCNPDIRAAVSNETAANPSRIPEGGLPDAGSRFSSTRTCPTASAKANSPPGRTGSHRSALVAVSDSRDSA